MQQKDIGRETCGHNVKTMASKTEENSTDSLKQEFGEFYLFYRQRFSGFRALVGECSATREIKIKIRP